MQDDPKVVFEFVRRGRFMKVSAIDMETGQEVSIIGDPAAGETEMKCIALAKLLKNIKK